MVLEDVSDKVEGMGDVSQEDSFQNADGTSYCIHTWSIICMHLIHRVGIKLYTYILIWSSHTISPFLLKLKLNLIHI